MSKNFIKINKKSILKDNYQLEIQKTIEYIQELYLIDNIPWVIGYSGGKDSSAVTQLTWQAIQQLPKSKRKKTVHVITSDTLVEQPFVSAWVDRSFDMMTKAAKRDNLPIKTHKLIPEFNQTFWVNLIGRGYPAPNRQFRWCTERMKIRPSNKFITDVVAKSGEAILLLGTRRAESTDRAKVMEKNAKHKIKESLAPNGTLENCLIFTPVEHWTNDDIWIYLTQSKNPWNINNKELLGLYSGATEDGECPVVIDTSTPSCGNSRFGCWTCTVVARDKSMEAMIKNDDEKIWMKPLLDFRDEIGGYKREQGKLVKLSDQELRNRRDFKRRKGYVHLLQVGDNKGKTVPGPYKIKVREYFLRKLLQAQNEVRDRAPKEFKNIELIRIEELKIIRDIWTHEENHFEDSLPEIYEKVTNNEYPKDKDFSATVFNKEDNQILEEVCTNPTGEIDVESLSLLKSLLSVEKKHSNMVNRTGIFDQLKKTYEKYQFANEEEATKILTTEQNIKENNQAILDKISNI